MISCRIVTCTINYTLVMSLIVIDWNSSFIYLFQGFYIVTYALGIYHLNLFIAFLTPKIDPQLNFDSGSFKF